VVHDGTVELASEPAGLIGSGKAEGPGPRTVVGDDLVAGEVVVLNEHDMASAIIVSFAGRGAGNGALRPRRVGSGLAGSPAGAALLTKVAVSFDGKIAIAGDYLGNLILWDGGKAVTVAAQASIAAAR